MLLDAQGAAFRAWLAQKDAGEGTTAAYASDVSCFYRWLCGRAGREASAGDETFPWRDVADADVIAYLDWLRAEGRQPSTVGRHLTGVRRFFVFLKSRRRAKHDPTAGIAAPSRRLPARSALDRDVTRMLAAAVGGEEWARLRNRAIVHLCAAGMTAREVADLFLGEVRLARGEVDAGVGTLQVRTVALDAAARQAVGDWIGTGRPVVARWGNVDNVVVGHRGEAMSRGGVWGVVDETGKSIGVEGRVNPRVLRNALAIRLLRGGKQPSEAAAVLGITRGHQSMAPYAQALAETA